MSAPPIRPFRLTPEEPFLSSWALPGGSAAFPAAGIVPPPPGDWFAVRDLLVPGMEPALQAAATPPGASPAMPDASPAPAISAADMAPVVPTAGPAPAVPTADTIAWSADPVPEAPATLLPVSEPAAPMIVEPAPEPPQLVPEDAFPSLAELDALLAASHQVPTVPDAATRAEITAMLSLDPRIAEDPGLFLATLAGLAPAEPEPFPGEDPGAPGAFAGVSVPEPWLLG